MGQAVSDQHKWKHLVSMLIEHTTWGILEKAASGNKNSLTRRRSRSWLFTFAIRGLRRKWRHLFSCILPKQSVPYQIAGDWSKYQWSPQGPSFSGVISGKITTSPLEDLVAGLKLFLEFKIKTQNGIIHDDRVIVLPSINGFCFTCYTFHPNTQIFHSSN